MIDLTAPEGAAISRSATDAPHAFGLTSASASPTELANLETARRYLAAIESDRGAPDDPGAAQYFGDDVVQVEFPNRLVPEGASRDLQALREAAGRGRTVMRGQRYEIRHAYPHGSTVVLEVTWIGTVAVPLGTIPVGGEMRAYFAVVLEFRDGRIVRQRNYDCFDPF